MDLKDKQRTRAGRILRRTSGILLGSLSVSIVITGLFAWLIRTDEDRILRRENKRLEAEYETLLRRESRIDEAVSYLQVRDNDIYRDIFYADAPSLEMYRNDDFLAARVDTLPQGELILYTARKADRLLCDAAQIEDNFREIARLVDRGRDTLPPMSLPIEGTSYTQIGASLGSRMSPLLKVGLNHTGLDILARQDTPVTAAADGTVLEVDKTRKGIGNTVEIAHAGGWKTRYSCLGEITVKAGQKVLRGQIIGTVGMSGTAFAPHLHYEVVRRDSLVCDPASHFFASVTPTEYMNMLYMSAHTGQSLD